MSLKHLTKGSSQPPLQKGKLRLYSMRFCPYAQRVHLVLDAKNIPYDTVYLNLTEKPEWYLEKLSTGKVPLIEFENGNILYESLIISDFLDEEYKQRPLYPKNPFLKAQDRLLLEHFNIIGGTVLKVNLKLDVSHIADHKEVIFKGLATFDKELAKRGTSFFGGSQPGMLDYMMWPFYERIDLLPFASDNKIAVKSEDYQHMTKWRDAMIEDPTVKKSYLSIEYHRKYLETKLAGNPDYNMLV